MAEYRAKVLVASQEFLATVSRIYFKRGSAKITPDDRHDAADIVLDTLEIAAALEGAHGNYRG